MRNASRDAIIVAPESGEMQNQLFLRLLEGQWEIIEMLRRIDSRMSGGSNEGTVVIHNSNIDSNNNFVVNVYEWML